MIEIDIRSTSNFLNEFLLMFDDSDREVSLSVLPPPVDAVSKPAHESWPSLLVEWKNTSTGLAWAKLTGVTLAP